MRRLKRHVIRILKFGTVSSTLLLIGSVSIQIVGRFLLESAPAWTEEASRFFFIYAISFASGLALDDGYYVHVDFVYNKLNEKARAILDVVINTLLVVFFILISIFSVQFILLGHSETSPSLGIPMSFAFVSILVMSLSMSFFGMEQNLRSIKNKL